MAQSSAPVISNRAERPWLLASNRKLRNVLSISLRNLRLSPPPTSHTRSKTTDDDALPQARKSPAKLVALREQHALQHSRSSSDLRGNGALVGEETERPIEASPKRPQSGKLRRRSTIEWANASPQSRQLRLEAVTKDRMVDVFFSLHIHGIEEPVYVSETVEKTMNPTFASIDWTACGPGVTRWDQLTIRVWAKGSDAESWAQLLQLTLDLRGLQYLGKSLAKLDRPLPTNAVIFHLIDGVYTTTTGSISDFAPPPLCQESGRSESRSQRQLPTSSFDAVLRLAKLDDSIQDALATRNQIARDLENLLHSNKQALIDRDTVSEAEDRLKTIDYAQKTVQKQLEKARTQQAEKRASLAARRQLMKSELASRTTLSQEIESVKPMFPALREDHQKSQTAIQSQRRRVCEELQTCYPILPLEGKTLAFQIRGIHLPNSEDLDIAPPENVAAALGYVAYVLQLLSYYLAQPLPYPVHPRGSTSTISDPISILKSQKEVRMYPLFSKGVPRFRFEYAVFLLNQNVRVMLESAYGLKMLDVRQTAPNLKYLLFVATAGEGEIVGRKAGGVRGLMRRDSGDSGKSGSGVKIVGNGRVKGAAERLREISGAEVGGRGKSVRV